MRKEISLESIRKMRSGDRMLSPVSKLLFLLCAALAIVALAVAGCNRAGYTHYGDSYEQYSQLWFPTSVEFIDTVQMCGSTDELKEMVKKSDAVVIGEFSGERTYCYRAFVSGIEVVSVVRGDKSLKGEKVFLMEPLRITKTGPADQLRRESPDFVADLEKRFKADERDGCFHYVEHAPVSRLAGLTPLKKGEAYLLFLQEKTLPDSLKFEVEGKYYYLMDNLFAVTSVSNDENRILAIVGEETRYLTMEEASGYDIVLFGDDGSVEEYKAAKARLRALVNL